MQTVTDATVKSSGTELNRAGVNNDCKDNSGASQACRRLGAPPSALCRAMYLLFGLLCWAQLPTSRIELRAMSDSQLLAPDAAGGAQAVNGQVSGGIQVAAAAAAGTYDSAGAREVGNNAAPAVVANTADAIKQAGIKNDCTGEAAQSQACRAAGGAGAVNGAASTAVSEGIAKALGARDDKQAGGCCCWEASKNQGKPMCSGGSSNWCGDSGCN